MISKKILLVTLILFLVLVVSAGCSISFKTKGGGGSDGGVYKTNNQGDSWYQRVLIPTTTGQPKNIGVLNTNSLVMDPNDEKAIYFGSIDNGLFYTYDGANEWRMTYALGKITVNAIAIDPKSKCIIYITSANKVFKSTDCNRTWEQIYFDNDLEVRINSIVVDYYNSNNIYLGSSRGEIIKSLNRGESWQTIHRFEDAIERILISPHDSRIIFVATSRRGIYRSTNSGTDWDDLSENLKEFGGSKNFKDLAMTEVEPGALFLASGYGLLKSGDNGDNWTEIKLITPEKKATINAMAVSPKNALEIYYVTNTTFYRSLDGGQNWTTKKLSTTQAGWKLLIDPEDTNIIYMGVRGFEK